MLALGVFQGLLNAIGWVLASDLRPGRQLRPVDHRPHHRDQGGAAPARREADQVDAGDAVDPAEGQGAAEEVQGQQGQDPRRDDEALQGGGGEPPGRLPPAPAAVPDPDRDVRGHPGTAAPARGHRRPGGGERRGHGLPGPQQPPPGGQRALQERGPAPEPRLPGHEPAVLRGAVGDAGDDLGLQPEPGQAGQAHPVLGRNGASVPGDDRRREAPLRLQDRRQDPLLRAACSSWWQRRSTSSARCSRRALRARPAVSSRPS